MPRFSAEVREQARELRDEILAEVEDKTDPRYLSLVATDDASGPLKVEQRDLSGLLGVIPIGDIAQQLGVGEDVAEAAVMQVLPGLVGGLAANANDENGEETLTKVLREHDKPVASRVRDVDTSDGRKIVHNVFGGNEDAVASKLASATHKRSVTPRIIKQVLPIVAPIVLSWLASQFLARREDDVQASDSKSDEGVGIGDLLGALLSSPEGQSMVADLLTEPTPRSRGGDLTT